MVPVVFLKRMSPYQPGEIAGFDDKESARLIQKGIAKAYQPEKKPSDKGDKQKDQA